MLRSPLMEVPCPRWLGPLELAVLVACALVTLPVPVELPLVAAASLSVAVRRATFLAPPAAAASTATAIGALAGLLGLGGALLLATPLLELGFGLSVDWSATPPVRGSLEQLVSSAIVTAAVVTAHELVFRRWIIERAFSLGASGTGAILAAAVAEAALSPGGLGARAGAALFGIALGLLYWRGGRRLGPALAARLTFALGALVLHAVGLG